MRPLAVHAAAPSCISFARHVLQLLLLQDKPLAAFCNMDAEAEAFFKILTELNVPEQLQQALMDAGISSVADYAYAYNSTADCRISLHSNHSRPGGTWGLQTQSTAAAARSRRADYAYAYNSAADLSHFIAQQPQQTWQDLGVADPEHCSS